MLVLKPQRQDLKFSLSWKEPQMVDLMFLILPTDFLDSRKENKTRLLEAEFWVATLMSTWKKLKELIKLLFNSANGLKLLLLQVLPQFKNYTKSFTLKLEKLQNSLKKQLNKIQQEIKRSSKKADLMLLKENRMSKREYKSDLNNSKNKRNDDK